jgi:hypothetical protein
VPLANRVFRLINRFGTLEPITVTRESEAVYSRVDGSVTNPNPDTFDTKTVRHDFEIQQVDGVTVQRGDQMLLIPGLLDGGSVLPFEPRAGDKVELDGKTWTVMSVKLLPFKSDLIALDLHVRAS